MGINKNEINKKFFLQKSYISDSFNYEQKNEIMDYIQGFKEIKIKA